VADKALGSSVADIVINPVFYCLHTYHNIIRAIKFKNYKKLNVVPIHKQNYPQ